MVFKIKFKNKEKIQIMCLEVSPSLEFIYVTSAK